MKQVCAVLVMLAVLMGVSSCTRPASDKQETTYHQDTTYQDDGTYNDGQQDDTAWNGGNQDGTEAGNTYISGDNRTPQNILTDPNDYEPGDPNYAQEPVYPEAPAEADVGVTISNIRLCDTLYHGLGDTYQNIYAYTGQDKYGTPSVGLRDYSYDGYYSTYFGNDRNTELLFYSSTQEYLQDQDSCYGGKGWFDELFEYDRTGQGYISVSQFANALNARETYFINAADEPDAPSNLYCDSLYVIKADVETALGTYSCTIEIEANSEDYGLGTDTWTKIALD